MPPPAAEWETPGQAADLAPGPARVVACLTPAFFR
jgi:hypothetical protein